MLLLLRRLRGSDNNAVHELNVFIKIAFFNVNPRDMDWAGVDTRPREFEEIGVQFFQDAFSSRSGL